MKAGGDFEVIRDPLWNNIRIDAEALEVLDSEPFQRLRFIRQLGHAFLVYPGATHTRFEHALGTYHLARRVLTLLAERNSLEEIHPAESSLIRLAALLHDVGHYPFSHALEEAGLPSHEDLAQDRLAHPDLVAILHATGIENAGSRLNELITGASRSPLQGLVSGSLDLDKIEYLTRDARMCGVPYGIVDVDRLLHSITVVTLGDGSKTVGIHEKGLSALESLLFAKYQMYRNVYWHHAVRSATSMFKRVVRDALQRRELEASWIAEATDEVLMHRLRAFENAPLVRRLWQRKLLKRVVELASSDLPEGFGDWITDDPDRVHSAEDDLARELGLGEGELLIDFPRKPDMLSVSLPVVTRSGNVEMLSDEHPDPRIGIHTVAEQLYVSARRFRVFCARSVEIDLAWLFGKLESA
ncbi:MAG: HD domain-containing protein [Gemmatimonadales bacterium]